MSRAKLNKAWIRRQGNSADGRKRYLLCKEIAGKRFTIALNPEKLWCSLAKKQYPDKEAEVTEESID